ncbi:MAG: oligosaccharide flippase family protein [Isosphaeraceae bacterium]|nr:oligosaccharide flippase family protein [Isosphaeraceae bacterium]
MSSSRPEETPRAPHVAVGATGIGSAPRRIASNFFFLTAAELCCRATSVVVTLALTERLGRGGFGRIEFGFNVVFWLVLIVRDGFEVIAARELARHRRLVRPLVNHILAVKLLISSVLYALLFVASGLLVSGWEERAVLRAYGLLLFTTALGLDFVYRALERMGLTAVSLVIRTTVYAAGVAWAVGPDSRLVEVPLRLVLGEAVGIGLVWIAYSREWGLPRPAFRAGFAKVIAGRGRAVLAIYFAQTMLTTIDMMLVGLLMSWTDSGLYSAPQRLIAAVLTLGMIFQQVVFPSLARAWRMRASESRHALDRLVRLLVLLFLPAAVGATVLAGPISGVLFPRDFEASAILLAVGIWRAPLLVIAFLYQGALIALNRESTASRYVYAAAAISPPAIAVGLFAFGLVGASAAMVVVSAGLLAAAYARLAAERRAPAWHHHVARPLAACAAMSAAAIPIARWSPAAAIVAGGVVYIVALFVTGAIDPVEIRALLVHRSARAEDLTAGSRARSRRPLRAKSDSGR